MTLARVAGAVDRRALDGVVNALAALVLRSGGRAARLQRGRIGGYVIALIAGTAVVAVLAYALGN
jgi:hypothetical protein